MTPGYKTRRGKRWAVRQREFAKHLGRQAAAREERRRTAEIFRGEAIREAKTKAGAKANAKARPARLGGRIAGAVLGLAARLGRTAGRRGA